jgi:hypothetical protein
MGTQQDIRWGRISLAAVLVEAVLLAVILPLNAVSGELAYYSVPVLVFATAYGAGWWVARPLAGRFVLHGVLVAVCASAIYVALTIAMGVFASVPLLYHFSHGLRVIGGAAGAALAARGRTGRGR